MEDLSYHDSIRYWRDQPPLRINIPTPKKPVNDEVVETPTVIETTEREPVEKSVTIETVDREHVKEHVKSDTVDHKSVKTPADNDAGVQSLTEPDETVYNAVSVAEDKLKYASDKNIVIVHVVSAREAEQDYESSQPGHNKNVRWGDQRKFIDSFAAANLSHRFRTGKNKPIGDVRLSFKGNPNAPDGMTGLASKILLDNRKVHDSERQPRKPKESHTTLPSASARDSLSNYQNEDATETMYTKERGATRDYEEWSPLKPGESSKRPEGEEKDPNDPEEPGSSKNPDKRNDRKERRER